MKYPLKLIEWEDAFNGDHNWVKPENLDLNKTMIVQTVGFEIERTDRHVILAGSVSDQSDMCDLFTIPLTLVLREQTFRNRLT